MNQTEPLRMHGQRYKICAVNTEHEHSTRTVNHNINRLDTGFPLYYKGDMYRIVEGELHVIEQGSVFPKGVSPKGGILWVA